MANDEPMQDVWEQWPCPSCGEPMERLVAGSGAQWHVTHEAAARCWSPSKWYAPRCPTSEPRPDGGSSSEPPITASDGQ